MVYILIATSHNPNAEENQSEYRPYIDFFADGTIAAIELAKLALTKKFHGLNVELVRQEGRPKFNEGPYWYGFDPHAEVEVYFMELSRSNIDTIHGLFEHIIF